MSEAFASIAMAAVFLAAMFHHYKLEKLRAEYQKEDRS